MIVSCDLKVASLVNNLQPLRFPLDSLNSKAEQKHEILWYSESLRYSGVRLNVDKVSTFQKNGYCLSCQFYVEGLVILLGQDTTSDVTEPTLAIITLCAQKQVRQGGPLKVLLASA